MARLLNLLEIEALYAGDTVRQNVAYGIEDEAPDAYSDSGGSSLYDEDRVRAWVAAKMPPPKPHPTIWIPSATPAEDKATLQSAGADKIAARLGIASNAVVAYLAEFTDPTAEGTAAWWHVSRDCRMFETHFRAGDVVSTRSDVEMIGAGHRKIS